MSHLRGVLGALIATSAAAFLFVTSISIAAQAPTPAPAQTSRTVQDGVFSDAQATRGQALYGQRCAGCHGPALTGAQGPPLTGEAFVNKFRMEPLSALFIKIRYKMPPTPPGATPGTPLTSEQAADLVAHVLKSNGFPAGKTDFASSDAVNSEIGWPAAATPPSSRAPTGTLNQLMRGWIQYFRLAEVKGIFEELDGWLRRKLRGLLWRRWKRPFTRAKNLMKRGLERLRAWRSATNGRGAWWKARASHLNEAFPKSYFDRLGLISLLDQLRKFQFSM